MRSYCKPLKFTKKKYVKVMDSYTFDWTYPPKRKTKPTINVKCFLEFESKGDEWRFALLTANEAVKWVKARNKDHKMVHSIDDFIHDSSRFNMIMKLSNYYYLIVTSEFKDVYKEEGALNLGELYD